MHVGMDASGTPDLMGTNAWHDPYVVCLAGVEDITLLADLLATVRKRFGIRAAQEFHAHQLPEEIICAVLTSADEAGMVIGALLLDKVATRRAREAIELPPPALLQEQAALALLEDFIDRYVLEELHFDEDIQGRKRQSVFSTAVKRLHRARWPGQSIKVRPSPSDQSDLIQMADVAAYVLGRKARGAIQSQPLRVAVTHLAQDTRNLIQGPKVWDR